MTFSPCKHENCVGNITINTIAPLTRREPLFHKIKSSVLNIIFFRQPFVFSQPLFYSGFAWNPKSKENIFKTFIKCYQVSNQTLEEACIIFCHCIIKYINYRSEFLCASSNFLLLTYLKNIHLEGEPLKTTFRC